LAHVWAWPMLIRCSGSVCGLVLVLIRGLARLRELLRAQGLQLRLGFDPAAERGSHWRAVCAVLCCAGKQLRSGPPWPLWSGFV
jgi:hypothetical protein